MSIRTYVDTSVFGGTFDEEFRDGSTRFFAHVSAERFRIVTSPLVSREIGGAPQPVRELFSQMLLAAEMLVPSADAIRLQRAYLRAGIVSGTSATDALHVALATVARCAMIVSWNFKDIVHFRKIPLYNAINRANGYGSIGIYSPLEVIELEDEDV